MGLGLIAEAEDMKMKESTMLMLLAFLAFAWTWHNRASLMTIAHAAYDTHVKLSQECG